MLVKCYHVNLTSCFKVNRDNAPFKSLQKSNFCMPILLYMLGDKSLQKSNFCMPILLYMLGVSCWEYQVN